LQKPVGIKRAGDPRFEFAVNSRVKTSHQDLRRPGTSGGYYALPRRIGKQFCRAAGRGKKRLRRKGAAGELLGDAAC
jgi:hypothetical protein